MSSMNATTRIMRNTTVSANSTAACPRWLREVFEASRSLTINLAFNYMTLISVERVNVHFTFPAVDVHAGMASNAIFSGDAGMIGVY